jgi:hypothetical protein
MHHVAKRKRILIAEEIREELKSKKTVKTEGVKVKEEDHVPVKVEDVKKEATDSDE